MRRGFAITIFMLAATLVLLLLLKKENFDVEREGILDKGFVSVTYLDIGQGDATLIEWWDGTQMLVDCSKDARILEALGRVMDYYDRSIDYLVVTHPDLDHYGGCSDVLERFVVQDIVYTGFEKGYDEAWQFFLQSVEQEVGDYTMIYEEQKWEIVSTTLHILYPDHDVRENPKIPGLKKEGTSNNSSIVFKLIFGESDLLFMADAESELEEYLLEVYSDDLDVEVLKAGHHGSAGSSIADFVYSTSPDIAVFSSGLGNNFGHPSRRVTKRFERLGSEILRTDLMGDVRLRVYEDKIEVVN